MAAKVCLFTLLGTCECTYLNINEGGSKSFMGQHSVNWGIFKATACAGYSAVSSIIRTHFSMMF